MTDTKNNKQDFLDKLHVYDSAGVGVIIVRTREIKRAIATIRHFAKARSTAQIPVAFKNWTILHGWTTYDDAVDDTEEVAPSHDGVPDALTAMKMIDGVGGGDPFPGGFYCMETVDFFLPQAPVLFELIREYADTLPASDRRLILVTPDNVKIPKAIEDDVTVMDFLTPSVSEMGSIYDELIEEYFDSPPYNVENRDRILSSGGGLTATQFEEALGQSLIVNHDTLPNTPVQDFARVIHDAKVEAVRKSEVLEVLDPVKIDQVGGLDNVKAWLQEAKVALTPEALEAGVDPLCGMGLVGVPGTGKSLIAKATAYVLGVPCIRMDVGACFGSLVGESEGKVRAALAMLKSMAPCVAFLDEVDKAGLDTRGGSGDSGTSSRVMGSILTFMQETEESIFWVMTANRTANIPPEMTRKGRMDEIWCVSPPNSVERMEVLKIHLRKRKVDPDSIEGLERLVTETRGFVSAEIESVVKDAKRKAVATGDELNVDLMVTIAKNLNPLCKTAAEDFRAMDEWAKNNARMASLPDEEGNMLATKSVPARSRTRAVKPRGGNQSPESN